MEHSFAKFIRFLGKGQKGARDLTQEEARQALGEILGERVEAVQLGAFLSLMRVKEETPAEVAGFVAAVRDTLPALSGVTVDLDWASYAGKRRQLPWYLLSALLLAEQGIRVLMHGMGQGDPGRIYIPQALAALGLGAASSLPEAGQQVAQRGFAFVPIEVLHPGLDRLLALKSLLGLRSPIHTVARMINPLAAPLSLLGVFHPGYDEVHQHAATLLGDPCVVVFKGEGGEAERNPDAPCGVRTARDGIETTDTWPALFDHRHLRDERLDCQRLRQLWEGSLEDEYGQAAVIATAAIVWQALGRAVDQEGALEQVQRCWERRDRQRFSAQQSMDPTHP